MTTFKLFKPANLTERETLPTKSFVKLVGEYVLVIIDKDYGDKIKIHGEKSDVILSKIDIKSNIILNNMRQVTISCDTLTSSICNEITILFHIKDDTTYFSKAAVYVVDTLALSDAIGDDNLTYLDFGTIKLTESSCNVSTITIMIKPSNFIIVSKLAHKEPLVKVQMHYSIPDDFIIITDRDYGENIIISKNDKKLSLTRMNTLSCKIIDKAKKLSVSYIDDILWDNAKCAKRFYVPVEYSEPTAYITSLEEFVSVIGKNYFCQLGYDLLGFSEN